MNNTKPMRRKIISPFTAVTMSIPTIVAKELEKRAKDEFGDNKSAVCTVALAAYLDVPLPDYLTGVPSASAL